MREYKWSNQNRAARNAYPLGSSAPLSKPQKANIAQLARSAAQKLDLWFDDTAAFNAWRHGEQLAAVGKESLRNCNQNDYKPLLAHFHKLGGELAQAFDATLVGQMEPRRVAVFKLQQQCKASGVTMGYAAAIARNRWKCTIDELDVKRLWQLVFTVKNRKKSNRRTA